MMKSLTSWMFDKQNSRKIFIDMLTPLTYQMMQKQSAEAFKLAEGEPREIDITDRVVNYVADRISAFADETDIETENKLNESIKQGIANGESVAQLKKRIRDIFEEATTVRSERIARTETIAGSNEAALEAYQQSPLVAGQEWLAEPDACEFCLAFNGKVIGLSESFLAVGQSVTGTEGGSLTNDWLDANHPPIHPNCRCTILPVSAESMSQ